MDRDGVAAYLEVADGSPLALYKRFAFAPHGVVEPGADAPRMATMWRA